MTKPEKPSLKEQKQNRAKWVAALRSGEYKQTTGMLEYEDTFCCLGVLCNLAHKEGIVMREPAVPNSFGCVSYDGRDGCLPVSVMDWVGLTGSVGNFRNEQLGASSLVDLNDTRRWTFEQIADLIESKLGELFNDS